MRQKTCGSLVSMFSQDEIEVALTLLELPKLIKESDSRSWSWSWSWSWPSSSWAVRRRRSSGGLTARQRLFGSPSKSPPPSSATPVYNCLNDTVSSRLSAYDKIDSGSPDTPLSISFSPRECDENPKRLTRKVCGKRSKEELVKEVQELTEDNKRLRTERDQLLGLYAQRKEENSALKLLEQHLLTEAGSCSLGIKSRPAAQIESICIARELHPNQDQDQDQNQKPLIVDQTASKVVTGGKYWSPKGPSVCSVQSSNVGGLGMAGDNAACPSGAPYFNASQGEPESLQLREQRLLAAQARQRRMQICRVKNLKVCTKFGR